MARTMQDLSEGIFISIANSTLAHRDSYLEYLHAGVKKDTLYCVLLPSIYSHFSRTSFLVRLKRKWPEVKRGVRLASHTGNPIVSIHMLPMTSRLINRTRSRLSQLGSKYANKKRKVVANLPLSHRNWPRVLRNVNENYCVNYVTGLKDFACVPGKECLNPSLVMTRSTDLTNKSETVNLPVIYLLCCKCSFCHWVATKERHKSQLLSQLHRNKICERCFLCRSLELCKSCHKFPTVDIDPPVGARLHLFWEKWEALGSSPKVVTALREGYTLPLRFRPNLTRSPTVISYYVNPQNHSHLLEALYQLVKKNAVEPVANQISLGFYNRLFLVPKPNNQWRPILDLSTLNTFLNTESFKMETPETMRTSLQTGEWVTSIDFKHAYFHIPIHSQSMKYMRFLSRVGPTSSKPYPLACPQHQWNSQWWPKR